MTDPRKLQLHEWKGAVEVSGGIGEGLDKMMEEARVGAARSNGGKVALREQAKKLQSVHAAADKEFAEDKFDLETLSLVKRYVTLCITATENAALHQESEEMIQTGRVDAYKRAVEVSQRFHSVAKGRFDQLNAPLPAEDVPGERPPRNGHAKAADRRAEEKAPAKPKKAPAKPRKKATKKTTAKKT